MRSCFVIGSKGKSHKLLPGLKKELVDTMVEIVQHHLPYCPIRYAFKVSLIVAIFRFPMQLLIGRFFGKQHLL